MRSARFLAHPRLMTAALALFLATFWSPLAEPQTFLEPISERQVEQYIRWLSLDDQQADLARLFHDEYMIERRERFYGQIRAFSHDQRETIRIVMHEGGNPGELAKQHYPELERKKQVVRDELGAQDERLFTQIESLLSDEKLPLMQRIRLSRARDQYQPKSWDFVLPETKVDLIDLLERMFHDSEVYDDLAAFMLEFEPGYVQAMHIDYNARIQRDIDRWDEQSLEFGMQRKSPPVSEVERQRLLQEFRLLRDQSGRRRIAAAVVFETSVITGVNRLREILSEEDFARFALALRAGSFPTIYPDPASAEHLFCQVVRMDELRISEREAVEFLRDQFRREHERLSDAMRENRSRSLRLAMRSAESSLTQLYQLNREFPGLGESRYTLCARQIDLIRRVIRPELHTALPEWDFQKHPRRKPWDSLSEHEFAQREREAELHRRLEERERHRQERIDDRD